MKKFLTIIAVVFSLVVLFMLGDVISQNHNLEHDIEESHQPAVNQTTRLQTISSDVLSHDKNLTHGVHYDNKDDKVFVTVKPNLEEKIAKQTFMYHDNKLYNQVMNKLANDRRTIQSEDHENTKSVKHLQIDATNLEDISYNEKHNPAVRAPHIENNGRADANPSSSMSNR